jgi:putative ABC transport system ATP-binding protein
MARTALDRVGLSARATHKPNELSGGQQQRVAIARAIVNDPVLILADEPTGNLDTRTSHEIMALFQELNRQGKTIVLVTHEQEIAEHCKRIIRFRDGKVESDERIEDPVDARVELAKLPAEEDE